MKNYLLIASTLICFANGSYFDDYNGKSHVITIKNIDKEMNEAIPLSCSGWCVVGVRILKNTANDSTKVLHDIIAPHQTGLLYEMECFDCFVNTEWKYKYFPYKATQGEIVLKFFIRPG